jgi:hypothetical protein
MMNSSIDFNFDALRSYDIRHEVYGLLELPPLATDATGFALSYKADYEETRLAAIKLQRKRLAAIEAEFKGKTGFAISTSMPTPESTFKDLSTIVITVPASLSRHSSHNAKNPSNLEPLSDVPPLFCQTYDNITVVIKDTPGSRSLRTDLDLQEDIFNDWYGKRVIQELADTTAHSTYHANRYYQHRYEHVHRYCCTVDPPVGDLLANLVSPPPRHVYPDSYSYDRATQLRTKRIAIAYEFRPTADFAADAKLTGESYRLTGPSASFRPADVAASSSGFYEMTSSDGLVGEVGMTTGYGWALSHVGKLHGARVMSIGGSWTGD